MTTTLDSLLADLAAYPGTPDDACLSLPPAAYTSPELYAFERERIFRHSWLCVGRDEYVPSPGDYYRIDVLDEPMIIVRGADGAVRALNAACRHRNMLVVQGRGNARGFTCSYHSWSYATNGRLLAAPHMEQSRAFDKASCRLPEYRLDHWMGFLFVNVDDEAAPLRPVMASMERAVANYRIAEQTEVFHYEAEWAGNWKLAAENSMEYYHHIGLHAGTVGVQLPAKNTYIPAMPAADDTFTHERCRMGERFLAGQDHPMNPRCDLRELTEEERTTGYLVYVFPAFTMAMRPRHQQLALLPSRRPGAHDRARRLSPVEGPGTGGPGGRPRPRRDDRKGQRRGFARHDRARQSHALRQGRPRPALPHGRHDRPVPQIPGADAGGRPAFVGAANGGLRTTAHEIVTA